MFIQTEATPNPATLKFLPGCAVMETGTAYFTQVDDAGHSPLAMRIFGIEGVAGIFLGSDFITVTKQSATDWEALKTSVLASIMDHYTSGDAIIIISETTEGGNAADEGVVGQICELLDTRVRPMVAQDGGDIIFDRYEDGIVFLHMQGACAGCPSSGATLKNGVENMLKYYIPEIQEVRQIL